MENEKKCPTCGFHIEWPNGCRCDQKDIRREFEVPDTHDKCCKEGQECKKHRPKPKIQTETKMAPREITVGEFIKELQNFKQDMKLEAFSKEGMRTTYIGLDRIMVGKNENGEPELRLQITG